MAKSIWGWDEALFCLGMRAYDVSTHHPHPPGFPAFMAMAKLARVIVGSDFRALQSVNLTAGVLLFPSIFLLARELRFRFAVAASAATLCAFFPNVWFFGGTALSDVPSMVLAIVACALLLRGVRSSGSLILGAILLAVAVGFRPQNLLIGCVPALIACRRWKAAVIGAVIGLAIIASSYATAANVSGGWSAYRDAVAHHEHYIRVTDSFLSPIRPPLWKVADDFFFRPYRVPFLNIAIAVLIVLALVRRRPWSLVSLATFGPFVLFAWLYLDFHSTSRFSIAYMPLFAILAADGLEMLGRLRTIVLAALIAVTIGWMLPPLRVVRDTASPPVAAAEWIRRNHRGPVSVDPRVEPFAALLLHDYERRPLSDPAGVVLREGSGTLTFSRERERLSRALTRPRYFEISVERVR